MVVIKIPTHDLADVSESIHEIEFFIELYEVDSVATSVVHKAFEHSSLVVHMHGRIAVIMKRTDGLYGCTLSGQRKVTPNDFRYGSLFDPKF